MSAHTPSNNPPAPPSPSRHAVFSFGCRLNHAEGEEIASLLKEARPEVETLVVNSCAVTDEAERQVRQKIRRLARERAGARIVVVGCAVHLNAERYRAMAGVQKVLGNDTKLRASSYSDEAASKITTEPPTEELLPRAERERQTPLHAPVPVEQGIEQGIEHGEGMLRRTRFVLPVQQGCNHHCTFCVIPLARGQTRSLPVEQVSESVRQAVARGINEVVLSGIDLASWGEDFEGRPLLGTLVAAVLRENSRLQRLRLSSIDGAALDPLLQKLFAEEQRLMPYLHLSLQSGDDMILKRMRRRHSRAQAIELCQSLRAQRKDLMLGADMIAGFPTETEEMFHNTLKFVDEAGLHLLHVFPFSPRIHTPAARMPQVARNIVCARARLLRTKAEEVHTAFLQEMHGKTESFLVERDDEQETIGRARNNLRTRLLPVCDNSCDDSRDDSHDGSRTDMKTGASLRGRIVKARILSTQEQPCARTLTARLC